MYHQATGRLFLDMTNTTGTLKGTLAERLRPIREQEAHRADVAERGLEALLAPYCLSGVWPPEQRDGQ